MINKVEEFRNLLTDVHEAQKNAGSIFEQAKITIAALTEKSAEIQKQQADIENSLSRLPGIVDDVIEQRLSRIIEQMEIRISERLRDELKETRTTLREAHESRAAQTESQMEKIKVTSLLKCLAVFSEASWLIPAASLALEKRLVTLLTFILRV
ncbi:Uncharacterised protein [Cedecea neteri]|uniref:Uncharacterized protein n=1 Tax=Cedecea neteri TaxID=158822 RepID=A0A2X3JFD2_9ENTR|nr:Uncharacterised protein [Cedecea neteri]